MEPSNPSPAPVVAALPGLPQGNLCQHWQPAAPLDARNVRISNVGLSDLVQSRAGLVTRLRVALSALLTASNLSEKGEVTWDLYEEPGFIMISFLASSDRLRISCGNIYVSDNPSDVKIEQN